MPFLQSKQGKALLVGVNAGLFVLAMGLGLRLLDRPALDAGEKGPSPKLARSAAGPAEFARREAPPSLDEALKRSRGFMARFDARPKPPPRASAPSARRLVRKVAFRPKKPAYNWGDLRLAGVVTVRKRNPRAAVRQPASGLILLSPALPVSNYAIVEYRKTRRQVLLSEGETLRNGARVLEIRAERVVLEAGGERKVLEVSPEKPKAIRAPLGATPVLANSRRAG